jgi:hypothetical protein
MKLEKSPNTRPLNHIVAKVEPGGRYMTIFIDGKEIDALHNDFVGLVPVLNDCFFPDSDRALVWRLIEPRTEGRVIAPLLVCGDDCDLYCTIIVADISYLPNVVTWERFGIDRSEREYLHAERIGTTVNWIADIPPMTFDREEYVRCIETLKFVFDGNNHLSRK